MTWRSSTRSQSRRRTEPCFSLRCWWPRVFADRNGDNGISCVPCSASKIASNTNVVAEEFRNYGLLHFACNFARVSTQRRSQIIGTRPFLRPPLGVQAQEHLLVFMHLLTWSEKSGILLGRVPKLKLLTTNLLPGPSSTPPSCNRSHSPANGRMQRPHMEHPRPWESNRAHPKPLTQGSPQIMAFLAQVPCCEQLFVIAFVARRPPTAWRALAPWPWPSAMALAKHRSPAVAPLKSLSSASSLGRTPVKTRRRINAASSDRLVKTSFSRHLLMLLSLYNVQGLGLRPRRHLHVICKQIHMHPKLDHIKILNSRRWSFTNTKQPAKTLSRKAQEQPPAMT